MLVCFEGMDGVGKSCVTKQVSEKLNVTYVEKPVKNLFEMTEEEATYMKDKIYDNFSTKIQCLYYLFGYMSVIDRKNKEDMICDRGVLSTYYYSHNDENDSLYKDLLKCFGTSDLIIILYASPDIRVSRIKARNASDYDLKVKRVYENGYDKFFEGVKYLELPYVVLNTERLTTEEVTSLSCMIITALKSYPNLYSELNELLSIENLENIGKMSYNEIDSKIKDIISRKDVKKYGKVYKQQT